MPRFLVKATITTKDAKPRNLKGFAEVLNFVRVNEYILTHFTEKYNDWSRNFTAEWNSGEAAKSRMLQRTKLSLIAQILVAAVVSFCIFEYYRTSDASYLILGLCSYLSIIIMNFISFIAVFYVSSPSKCTSTVREFFVDVSSVLVLLVSRLKHLQRKFNLEIRPLDLHINAERWLRETKRRHLLSSIVSSYSIYGILLAFGAYTLCSHYQYENFELLEIVTWHLMIAIAVAKDVEIIRFVREMKRKRRIMSNLTEDFTYWFEYNCILKILLKESGINDEALPLFSGKLSRISKNADYLNSAIVTAAFSPILNSDLPKYDVENVISFLIYGYYSKISRILIRNINKEDVEISVKPTSFEEITRNSDLLTHPVRSCLDEKGSRIRMKSIISKKEDDPRQTDHSDDTGENKLKTDCKNERKSRIPKYANVRASNISPDEHKPNADIGDASETKFGKNLKLRYGLRKPESKQEIESSSYVAQMSDVETTASLAAGFENNGTSLESQNRDYACKSSTENEKPDLNDVLNLSTNGEKINKENLKELGKKEIQGSETKISQKITTCHFRPTGERPFPNDKSEFNSGISDLHESAFPEAEDDETLNDAYKKFEYQRTLVNSTETQPKSGPTLTGTEPNSVVCPRLRTKSLQSNDKKTSDSFVDNKEIGSLKSFTGEKEEQNTSEICSLRNLNEESYYENMVGKDISASSTNENFLDAIDESVSVESLPVNSDSFYSFKERVADISIGEKETDAIEEIFDEIIDSNSATSPRSENDQQPDDKTAAVHVPGNFEILTGGNFLRTVEEHSLVESLPEKRDNDLLCGSEGKEADIGEKENERVKNIHDDIFNSDLATCSKNEDGQQPDKETAAVNVSGNFETLTDEIFLGAVEELTSVESLPTKDRDPLCGFERKETDIAEKGTEAVENIRDETINSNSEDPCLRSENEKQPDDQKASVNVFRNIETNDNFVNTVDEAISINSLPAKSDNNSLYAFKGTVANILIAEKGTDALKDETLTIAKFQSAEAQKITNLKGRRMRKKSLKVTTGVKSRIDKTRVASRSNKFCEDEITLSSQKGNDNFQNGMQNAKGESSLNEDIEFLISGISKLDIQPIQENSTIQHLPNFESHRLSEYEPSFKDLAPEVQQNMCNRPPSILNNPVEVLNESIFCIEVNSSGILTKTTMEENYHPAGISNNSLEVPNESNLCNEVNCSGNSNKISMEENSHLEKFSENENNLEVQRRKNNFSLKEKEKFMSHYNKEISSTNEMVSSGDDSKSHLKNEEQGVSRDLTELYSVNSDGKSTWNAFEKFSAVLNEVNLFSVNMSDRNYSAPDFTRPCIFEKSENQSDDVQKAEDSTNNSLAYTSLSREFSSEGYSDRIANLSKVEEKYKVTVANKNKGSIKGRRKRNRSIRNKAEMAQNFAPEVFPVISDTVFDIEEAGSFSENLSLKNEEMSKALHRNEGLKAHITKPQDKSDKGSSEVVLTGSAENTSNEPLPKISHAIPKGKPFFDYLNSFDSELKYGISENSSQNLYEEELMHPEAYNEFSLNMESIVSSKTDKFQLEKENESEISPPEQRFSDQEHSKYGNDIPSSFFSRLSPKKLEITLIPFALDVSTSASIQKCKQQNAEQKLSDQAVELRENIDSKSLDAEDSKKRAMEDRQANSDIISTESESFTNTKNADEFSTECEQLSTTDIKDNIQLCGKENSKEENGRINVNEISTQCERLSAACTKDSVELSETEDRNKLSLKSSFMENRNEHSTEQIQSWIHDVDSALSAVPEKSFNIVDTPLTGTSEDSNFHFHSSTSPTDNSSNIPVDPSELSNDTGSNQDVSENVKNDEENRGSPERTSFETMVSHDTSMRLPNSRDPGRGYGIAWESTFSAAHQSFHEQYDAPQADNTETIVNEQSYAIRDRTKPFKYHLKYENLDLDISDSASSVTIRMVSEKDDGHLTPKWRKLVENSLPSSTSSLDECLITVGPLSCTREDSTNHHNLNIEENGLKMSVDLENLDEIPPNLTETSNSTTHKNILPGSYSYKIREIKGNAHHFTSEFNAESTQNISNPKETNKSPYSIDKTEIQTENHCYRASETPSTDSLQKEFGIDDNTAENESGLAETQNTDLEIEKYSEDFQFETENVKLNYKPDADSDSIEVKFRRCEDLSTLTFKSIEKKLYVKLKP